MKNYYRFGLVIHFIFLFLNTLDVVGFKYKRLQKALKLLVLRERFGIGLQPIQPRCAIPTLRLLPGVMEQTREMR